MNYVLYDLKLTISYHLLESKVHPQWTISFHIFASMQLALILHEIY
jgi:hypothetical protein